MLNIYQSRTNTLIINSLYEKTTYPDASLHYLWNFVDFYGRNVNCVLVDDSSYRNRYSQFYFTDGSDGTLRANGEYNIYESPVDSSTIDASTMNLLVNGQYTYWEVVVGDNVYDPSIYTDSNQDSIFDPIFNPGDTPLPTAFDHDDLLNRDDASTNHPWALSIEQAIKEYIRDSSLGSQFFWNSGELFVSDVSGGTGYATIIYVDLQNDIQDASIVILRAEDVRQDGSLNALFVENDTQDSSIIILRAEDVRQDGSLNLLFLENDTQDASIVYLRNEDIRQDGSLNALFAEDIRIDGSLNVLFIEDIRLDSSITYLYSEIGKNDASIDELYVENDIQDASIVILRNEDIRIDGSLNVLFIEDIRQDGSLNVLFIEDIRQDGSINALFQDDGRVDGSLNALFLEDIRQDASITNLIIEDLRLDGSISSLITEDTRIDGSLNTLFLENDIQDASIVLLRAEDVRQDGSLNALFVEDIRQDGSLNKLFLENDIQDASIVLLRAKDANIDTSLNSLWDKNYSQDASILLRATKVYVDGSLGLRDTSIAWLKANKMPIDASLSSLVGVTVTSPVVDQILKYNGAEWVNKTNTGQVSAGAGVSLYLDDASAYVATYKQLTFDPVGGTEDIDTVAVTSGTSPVLIDAYASPSEGLFRTAISGGLWKFHTYGKVGAVIGESKILMRVYRRGQTGTENLLFETSTGALTTSVELYETPTIQPSYDISLGDFLVVKYYATTTSVPSRNISLYHNGTAHYSYIETPLHTLHNDLAGLQGGMDNEYYHFTSADYVDRVGKTYVDGSLSLRDTSIAYNANKNISQDASIVLLRAEDVRQDGSIGALFIEDIRLDGSISALFTENDNQDILIAANDASIVLLRAEDVRQDGSINLLFQENDAQDTSIAWLNTNKLGIDTSLSSLSDVSIFGATDGSALVYEVATGLWIPGTGGGGAIENPLEIPWRLGNDLQTTDKIDASSGYTFDPSSGGWEGDYASGFTLYTGNSDILYTTDVSIIAGKYYKMTATIDTSVQGPMTIYAGGTPIGGSKFYTGGAFTSYFAAVTDDQVSMQPTLDWGNGLWQGKMTDLQISEYSIPTESYFNLLDEDGSVRLYLKSFNYSTLIGNDLPAVGFGFGSVIIGNKNAENSNNFNSNNIIGYNNFTDIINGPTTNTVIGNNNASYLTNSYSNHIIGVSNLLGSNLTTASANTIFGIANGGGDLESCNNNISIGSGNLTWSTVGSLLHSSSGIYIGEYLYPGDSSIEKEIIISAHSNAGGHGSNTITLGKISETLETYLYGTLYVDDVSVSFGGGGAQDASIAELFGTHTVTGTLTMAGAAIINANVGNSLTLTTLYTDDDSAPGNIILESGADEGVGGIGAGNITLQGGPSFEGQGGSITLEPGPTIGGGTWGTIYLNALESAVNIDGSLYINDTLFSDYIPTDFYSQSYIDGSLNAKQDILSIGSVGEILYSDGAGDASTSLDYKINGANLELKNANAGIILGSTTVDGAHTIIPAHYESGNGNQLTISGGLAGAGGRGGDLVLSAGDGSGSNGADLILKAGNGTNNDDGGNISITAGNGDTFGEAGILTLSGGQSSGGGTNVGGDINLLSGKGGDGYLYGNINLDASNANINLDGSLYINGVLFEAAIAPDVSLGGLNDVTIIDASLYNVIQVNEAGTWENKETIDIEGYFQYKSVYKSPGSASAGTQGDFAYDASYFYICTSTNTWIRILGEWGY